MMQGVLFGAFFRVEDEIGRQLSLWPTSHTSHAKTGANHPIATI